MAAISLRNATKISSRRYILDNINLSIKDGQLTVIYGDKNSGKVSALRAIAGIDNLSSGDVFIDEVRQTKIKSGRRNVATVFEKQGLLPHKNVFENIALPLRLSKVPKPEIERRVKLASSRFDLDKYLNTKPKRLTELQRHLVGIARAYVRSPGAYLFQAIQAGKEPDVKKQVIKEMVRLVKEDQATVVYATDSSREALQIADRIAILSFGELVQIGTKHQIYSLPVDTSVAKIFGTPRINLFPGKILSSDENALEIILQGGTKIFLARSYVQTPDIGDHIILGIRPRSIELRRESNNSIEVNVQEKRALKNRFYTLMDSSEGDIRVVSENIDSPIENVHFPSKNCLLFDEEGNRLVAKSSAKTI